MQLLRDNERQNYWVGRTLLSAAFELDFGVGSTEIKVRGKFGGPE